MAISVESTVGEGSCFSFSIFTEEADNSSQKPCAAPTISASVEHSQAVLIADDNVINQRIAKGLLERRGHSVVVVNNGLEALLALNHQKFDLVLMDIQMPVMDGLTTVRRLRQDESTQGSSRQKVLALTASVMKDDLERALKPLSGRDRLVA